MDTKPTFKKPNTKEDTIEYKFYGKTPEQQVVIYAEARYQENYELLKVLTNLLAHGSKELFLKMVDDYLIAKYGKNYF